MVFTYEQRNPNDRGLIENTMEFLVVLFVVIRLGSTFINILAQIAYFELEAKSLLFIVIANNTTAVALDIGHIE